MKRVQISHYNIEMRQAIQTHCQEIRLRLVENMIVRIPEIHNQNHETGFHHLETGDQNPKKNPSQKIEDPENIDQGQENEGNPNSKLKTIYKDKVTEYMKRILSYYSNISGIVIDQMIVGSEIEIGITKVIGEADQGPENNTEMRKGIYTINEKQEYQ